MPKNRSTITILVFSIPPRHDEERKDINAKIAIDKTGFIEFVHDMNAHLSSLNDVLVSTHHNIDPKESFKSIHTIQSAVKEYNGTIDIQTKPGFGTTFIVEIPT